MNQLTSTQIEVRNRNYELGDTKKILKNSRWNSSPSLTTKLEQCLKWKS